MASPPPIATVTWAQIVQTAKARTTTSQTDSLHSVRHGVTGERRTKGAISATSSETVGSEIGTNRGSGASEEDASYASERLSQRCSLGTICPRRSLASS